MKALVVGGSSGIGLSIVLNLINRVEYEKVYVLDKKDFPNQYKTAKVYSLIYDLSLKDYSIFNIFEEINALFITVGFGHLDFFQHFDEYYIQDCFDVNAIAPIQIIRHYYDRLLSTDSFLCGIMVSIAGRLSSPLFSIYSATKAALCKFIEAVNVELDVQGSRNRILEVSPGSMKGTSFSGGISHPEMTAELAEEIIRRAQNHQELYIPEYEETYKNVIERYEADAHRFGIESFWYKMKRIENE